MDSVEPQSEDFLYVHATRLASSQNDPILLLLEMTAPKKGKSKYRSLCAAHKLIWIDGNVCFSYTRSGVEFVYEKVFDHSRGCCQQLYHMKAGSICFCSQPTSFLWKKSVKESQELSPRDCYCVERELRVKNACKAESIDLLENKVRCLIHFVNGLIEMEGLCVRNARITHVTIATTLSHKYYFHEGLSRVSRGTMLTYNHRHFFVNTV